MSTFMRARDRTTSVHWVDARVPTPTGRALLRVAGQREWTPVDRRGVLIGRSADCDICTDGRGLSRRHARVLPDIENGLCLVDLGSTNGTYVDGIRVDRAAVRVGSHILLGREVILHVRYEARRDVLARAGLTGRETEVARLIADGLRNDAIAARLEISPRTVTTHAQRIFRKLHVSSRLDLIRLWHREA